LYIAGASTPLFFSGHDNQDANVMDCDDPVRPKIITPAALYEMFTRNSQCVLNETGRCPLLVFTKQLCEELNSFFNED
jgi:hypothetical protein